MRTFVAIELPESVRQRLVARQRWLEQQLIESGAGGVVRWTATDNLHLTLRFLGETSVAQQAALAAAFTSLAMQAMPLEFSLHQLGCFPTFRHPSIVWIDLRGTLEALQQLQTAIETIAQASGFLPEERPFTPHLTIGRARRDTAPATLQQAGSVLHRLAAAPGAEQPTFTVSQFVLMQSDLRPARPTYTPLGAYRFTGDSPASPR